MKKFPATVPEIPDVLVHVATLFLCFPRHHRPKLGLMSKSSPMVDALVLRLFSEHRYAHGLSHGVKDAGLQLAEDCGKNPNLLPTSLRGQTHESRNLCASEHPGAEL